MSTLRSCIILIALIFSTGCISIAPLADPTREQSRWRGATTHPVRGVALVVHGLNMRPSAMDPLCDLLGGLGLHSYRITLTGHDEPTAEVFDETVWVNDVAKAYETVRAEFPELPTYIVAYSLGGLIVTHALDERSIATPPHALVLLAPALSLRTPLPLLAKLNLPPALSWSVPNIAPSTYRRYPATPIFWYSNTLTLYSATQSLTHAESLQGIPTLVALNPRDELISESGTLDWIARHNLTATWQTHIVIKDSEQKSLPEHVIVDEQSLGAPAWAHFKASVGAFLAKTNTHQ